MGKLGEAICVNIISRYFTANVFLKTYRPFFMLNVSLSIFFLLSILTAHQRNIAGYIVKKMFKLNKEIYVFSQQFSVWPHCSLNSCSLRNEKATKFKKAFLKLTFKFVANAKYTILC